MDTFKTAEYKEGELRKIIDGGEFWTIAYVLGFQGLSVEFLGDIENTYYSGEKNEDFLLAFMQPTQVFDKFSSIALAKKTHMSEEQLKEILTKYDIDIKRSFIERDIIFPRPNFVDIFTWNTLALQFRKWRTAR